MKFFAINLLLTIILAIPTFSSDTPQDLEKKYNREMEFFKDQKNDPLDISIDYLRVIVSAINGDARAQSFIGERYQSGDGIEQNFHMASYYHQLAADQGIVHSQYNLGMIYYEGLAGTQDYTLALDLFQKAAEQGYTKAHHNLGVMYRDGTGVVQDYSKALDYFYIAAAQGYEDSRYCIGAMQWNGQGMDVNHESAIIHFNLASKNGSEKAKEALENIKRSVGYSEKNTKKSPLKNLPIQTTTPLLSANMTKKTIKNRNQSEKRNNRPPISKRLQKEIASNEIKLEVPQIDKPNTINSLSDQTSNEKQDSASLTINSPRLVSELKKTLMTDTPNSHQTSSKIIVTKEETFKDKSEKQQSIIKTFKRNVKSYNDNREMKKKRREEKKELKKTKNKSILTAKKNNDVLDTTRHSSTMTSQSFSQTLEDSSFSVTENESEFSISEINEPIKVPSDEGLYICEAMEKAYPKLYRILNQRGATYLGQIKLKKSLIIYDTLLELGDRGLICGSWNRKNIHVQKKGHQDIVFDAHTSHGSSGYVKWYYNPEIIVDFITFVASCDARIREFCVWKFDKFCFSRETSNTSSPE